MKSALKKPIFLLIAVNLLIGFFIFRQYGLSWDEPLFYDYGRALGYAYNPANWFSGQFDLSNSYGASGDDHKNRGPAYLLLARNFVSGLEALGSDSAAAWHLINFLFFQLGIYFLYRFARRWVREPAALAATLLFATQPLLWGHAFVNPKDPPFLTFFLASVCLGFEMVDAIIQDQPNKNRLLVIAAIMLGITTSIRVLGPLAGLLVFAYLLFAIANQPNRNQGMVTAALRAFIVYGALTVLFMLATWPYLWENPLANFIGVFRFMSDNPTNLPVLFHREVFRASDLPRRYLPVMLAITLTEPVWFLCGAGLLASLWQGLRAWKSDREGRKGSFALLLVLGWFLILFGYVVLRRPAMYDGFRHFLFILPPVFIFCALAFEWVFSFSVVQHAPHWLYATLIGLVILPGVMGIIRLHPYEYAYYNSFVGGTDGAFRTYETEYWLTCYKEAVEQLNATVTTPVNLIVKREPYIAATYANPNINVIDIRTQSSLARSGDYVLVNTRTNEDRTTFKEAPIVLRVGRGAATFCIVRQIP